MGSTKATSFVTFATLRLRKRLDRLQVLVSKPLPPENAEYIHDVRVASRRVVAAIEVFAGLFDDRDVHTWEGDIRSLTKVLSDARDRDVQVGLLRTYLGSEAGGRSDGLATVLSALIRRRVYMQQRVEKSVKKLVASRALKQIKERLAARLSASRRQALRTRAYAVVAQRLQAVRRFERTMDRLNAGQRHKLRIRTKKLRYAIECIAEGTDQLAPYIEMLVKIQDSLGGMHDREVMLDKLPRWIEEEEAVFRLQAGRRMDSRKTLRMRRDVDRFARRQRCIMDSELSDFAALCRQAARDMFWDRLQASVKLAARTNG